MILLPGGIQSISIFDDNSSPSVAVTTTGVRDFSYDVAENYFETASGKRRVLSRVHTASMVIVDLGVIDQLKEWEANETLVQFVALGLSRHVQGYQDSIINITPLVSGFGSNTAYRVDIVNEQFTPDWHSYANLAWYVGWEDTVATGVPDNWSTAGANMSVTPTFASDELTLTIGSISATPNNARLLLDVPFPFPGVTVTMSSEMNVGGLGNVLLLEDGDKLLLESGDEFLLEGSKISIGMTVLDASGSALAVASQAVASAGRVSVSTTLPANTYTIRIFPIQIFNASTDDVGSSASCKFPSLFVGSTAPEARY